MKRHLTITGLVLLAALSAAGCESQDPEDFCQALVTKTCEGQSACCTKDTKFDEFQCNTAVWTACLSYTAADSVREGSMVFDSGAATLCFEGTDACGTSEWRQSKEQIVACQNMVTGYHPAGATCWRDADCERPGDADFAGCYSAGFDGGGVCVKMHFSTEDKCGFDAKTLVYELCPPETNCVRDPEFKATAPLEGIEFRGSCKPRGKKGEECGANDAGDYLPCADDLYCHYPSDGLSKPTCQEYLSEGQPCAFDSGQDPCKSGLACDGEKCVAVSPSEDTGQFCYAPAECGNGDCEPGETTESCAADCMEYCGDGQCTGDEPEYCFEDC